MSDPDAIHSQVPCESNWLHPLLQVLLGKSTCTEKVDIYSYGVVLWEICAGEAPTGRQLRPLRCVNISLLLTQQPTQADTLLTNGRN